MRVLGLLGSPRSDGNSHALLSAFMDRASENGAKTRVLTISEMNIQPCKEYTACEKTGRCPIHDDVEKEVYAALREADVVVLATPIFFYNMPAQIKALVDRCQTFWARKYRLHLRDPKGFSRKGVVLSCAATSGKQLFEGLFLTTKYFFDAIDATPSRNLGFSSLENKDDALRHPNALTEVIRLCDQIVLPLLERPKWVFYHSSNPQKAMAAAARTLQITNGAIHAVALSDQKPVFFEKDFISYLKEHHQLDVSYTKTDDTPPKEITSFVTMTDTIPSWAVNTQMINWIEPQEASLEEWMKWLSSKLETLF